MAYKERNILLLGPSGAGKSTLCNAIFHQNVELPSLGKPAGTSRRALGVTSKVTNYWCDNSLVITDTIGFDDSRFNPEYVAEQLHKLLKNTEVKYEKIILCLKLGRVSQPARVYLRLLKAIFEDPTSNMILYISGCEDGTTVEQFIENNEKYGDDADFQELIGSLRNKRENYKKKGLELNNIITGTLQSHQDRAIDERKFLDDRRETLSRIMSSIDVDIGFIRVKPLNSLWAGIVEWFVWHFKSFKLSNVKKKITSVKGLCAQLDPDTVVDDIEYTYGDCFICLTDKKKAWILLIPCFHRFHNECFRQKQKGACPKCNGEVKEMHLLPFINNSSTTIDAPSSSK